MLLDCQREKEISDRTGGRVGRRGSGNNQDPERDARVTRRNYVQFPHGNTEETAERATYSLVGKINSDPRGGCVR